jgi:hypothetical protein
MSTSSKPAIHQILETHLFSREEAYASRIHELEAVLDFVVQFNHGILPPLTHRWEYSLWPDGTLKEIAPTCELYTGFSRSDFLRNPDLLFSIVVPEDRERFRSHLQTVLNHPKVSAWGTKSRRAAARCWIFSRKACPPKQRLIRPSGGSSSPRCKLH